MDTDTNTWSTKQIQTVPLCYAPTIYKTVVYFAVFPRGSEKNASLPDTLNLTPVAKHTLAHLSLDK